MRRTAHRNPVAAAVEQWSADHLAAGQPVLVACSGGADSLALALATHEVLASAPDHPLLGVTVDHQLQAGSADRATGTADQLRAIGYRQVEIRKVEVAGSGGLEAAARRARYAALQLSAAEFGSSGRPAAVLLAHTADDQAETVLLGLARGSGPRSIAGMRPWRPPWGRPLLGIDRAATEASCRAAGLQPWHDPHNIDPAFTRVRIRHEVLPLLDEVLGGGVRAALNRTAELMAQDLAALDLIADAVLAQLSRTDGTLDAAGLAGQPAAVVGRVLRNWAAAGGVGALSFDHLHRMVSQVLDPGGPAQVRLPGGIDVLVDAGVLRLRPVPVAP